MSDFEKPANEFVELVDLLCLGEATAEQVVRLMESVVSDTSARRYYVRYLHMHASLPRILHTSGAPSFQPSVFAAPLPADLDTQAASAAGKGDCPIIAETRIGAASASTTDAPPSPPVLGFLGHAWHRTGSFLSDHEYFTGNLVATLFFAVAALIGSNVYVSTPEYSQYFAQHERERDDSPQPARGYPREEAAPEEEAVVSVAQITGKVDCVWADDSTAPAWHKIELNDKFDLKSGLMEITYYTGAKVILQGPCTYEVDSAAGGYLSLGKLTARVEKKGTGGAGRGAGEEAVASGQWSVASESTESRNPQIPKSPNPSSLTTNHQPLATNLFAVRTPTAVVTDLGTEFGVEVAKNGETQSHVFQGKVALSAMSDGKPMGDVVLLAENESAQVKREAGNDRLVVSRGKVDTTHFVQVEKFVGLIKQRNQTPLQHWQAYSRQLRKDPTLVAYYTCESASEGNVILPNLSSMGHALDGRIEGAAWTAGRVPGKCSLYFLGKGSGNKVILPENDCFEFSDAFSVAVWFKIGMYSAAKPRLVDKQDISWRIMYNSTPDSFAVKFDSNGTKHSTEDFQETIGNTYPRDNQWHLVVGVYEPDGLVARKRLYFDGRLETENTAAMPRLKNRSPVWLGSTGTWPEGEHQGWIDEVAIFSRALSAEEINKMFHSCGLNNE